MAWWDTILDNLPAIISAGSSIAQHNAAGRASDSSQAGVNAGIGEQRRQFDLIMQMLRPQQQLGTNAINTLSRLYGYAPNSQAGAGPAATSAIGSTGTGVNGSGGITQGVQGSQPGGIQFGADGKPKTFQQMFGFTPTRLQLTRGDGLTPEQRQYNDAYNAAYNKPSGISNIAGGILDVAGAAIPAFGALRAGANVGNSLIGGGSNNATGAPNDPGMSSATDYTANNPTSQGPADMSVFTQSPDYQFRRDEGNRDIGNSFAARGGALSGNALRGITDFNSNLASGEFNNFVQRQLQMAGLGGAATSQGVSAASNTGGNVSNLLQAGGNARASGIVDQSNALTGGANDLAGWFGDWMKKRNGAGSGGTIGSW